jgi:Fic family protein
MADHIIILAGHPFSFSVAPAHSIVSARLQNLDVEHDPARTISREAFSSATYEGGRVTRRETDAAITSQRPESRGEWMAFGVARSLECVRGLQPGRQRISHRLIRLTHRIATTKNLTDPNDCGRYRTRNDIVIGNPVTGKIIYRPPQAHLIPPMIEDLSRWHDRTPSIDPVVKAMILHYLIAWIHPFVDGNGRTARILFYWACHSAGIPAVWAISLSEQILASSSMYNKGYRLAQQSGCITPYLDRHTVYLNRAIDMATLTAINARR